MILQKNGEETGMNDEYYLVINEFFSIISPLLAFRVCDEIEAFEKSLISFLCKTTKLVDISDKLWNEIKETECIQTISDIALFENLNGDIQHPIAETKIDLLISKNIKRIKEFSPQSFVFDIKRRAFSGEKEACKLYSYMCWLGELMPSNRMVAIQLWELLSVSGDLTSLKALVFIKEKNDESRLGIKWAKLYEILDTCINDFCPVASVSLINKCDDAEISLSNMILLINQKIDRSKDNFLNLPMLQYVLHSKDDMEHKMQNILSEQNFYLLLQNEEKYGNKKFGF